MTKNKTNFLLIKYPPGAAGKMLVALLGNHPQIASWNKTQDSEEIWFKKHFHGQLNNWMNTEPQCPWPISCYVSSLYPRGDELTSLPINFPKNLYVPILWHKLYPPNFAKNFKSIVILVDKDSKKWFRRSRWKKHFNCEIENNLYKIYNMQHLPSVQIKNFNNSYIEYTDNLFGFIKEKVFRYDQLEIYSSKKNFYNENVFITLTDLIHEDSIIKCLDKITKELNLNSYNWNTVLPLWQHWRNLHNY
jgi:hypothetical protein